METSELGRVAVYTCVTGGYDRLRDPSTGKQEGIDFICFSDQPIESSVWERRYVLGTTENDRRKARRVKILGHRFLPEYDTLLWLDAAYLVRRQLMPLIRSWLNEADFALRRHPWRWPSCVYAEAGACLEFKKGDPEEVEAQADRYRQLGLPRRIGVCATGIIARRNVPAVTEFCEAWWEELSQTSDRDQLSFPYVAWRTGFPYRTIKPPDETNDHKPMLVWKEHRRVK